MSKSKTSITKDFENPMAEVAPGRGKGIFATLVVLSVVGLIVWLVMSNQES